MNTTLFLVLEAGDSWLKRFIEKNKKEVARYSSGIFNVVFAIQQTDRTSPDLDVELSRA